MHRNTHTGTNAFVHLSHMVQRRQHKHSNTISNAETKIKLYSWRGNCKRDYKLLCFMILTNIFHQWCSDSFHTIVNQSNTKLYPSYHAHSLPLSLSHSLSLTHKITLLNTLILTDGHLFSLHYHFLSLSIKKKKKHTHILSLNSYSKQVHNQTPWINHTF